MHFNSTVTTEKERIIVAAEGQQSFTDDPYIILEEELDSMSEDVRDDSTLNIRQELIDLSGHARLPFSANILQHWKNLSPKHCDLEKIAQVVLSATCNQFSPERSLRALSTVLTKKDCNLSDETLNNILLVKLNSELFEQIII